MATQLFNIEKKYEAKPSKNCIWEKNVSWEDAVTELQRIASSWTRNGGTVVEQHNTWVVVQEADGSETITFDIEEA